MTNAEHDLDARSATRPQDESMSVSYGAGYKTALALALDTAVDVIESLLRDGPGDRVVADQYDGWDEALRMVTLNFLAPRQLPSDRPPVGAVVQGQEFHDGYERAVDTIVAVVSTLLRDGPSDHLVADQGDCWGDALREVLAILGLEPVEGHSGNPEASMPGPEHDFDA